MRKNRVHSFIILLLLVLATLVAIPSVASAAKPRDARAFVDTIGVNVHLYYGGTVYDTRYPMVKQRLRELGIRHVRDGLDPDNRQWTADRMADMAANGFKGTMINCRFPDAQNWQLLTHVAKRPEVRPFVEALEGVNEPDLQQGGQHGGGAWWNDARGCDHWGNRTANSGYGGAPLNVPTYMSSPTSDRARHMGNLRSLGVDGGNMHPYPGDLKPSGPPYYSFAQSMADIRNWNFEGVSVPVIASETGYHDAINCPNCAHPPVSQAAEAIYTPRLILEYAKAGVERTFLYELVDLQPDPGRDDPGSNFGLFENDFSYKPVATALKNTIGFLDSPSASAQQPLGYSLSNTADPDGSGTGGAVKDMLMQKADGSWWLALWQDSTVYTKSRGDISNPTVRVGVRLDRTLTATGYRPTKGTGSYGSVTASSFTAGVSDDVLLIKLR
jgi:hypothetical protein